MTREEKMEVGFQKAAQMYKKTPEDITYKNLFAYVMIGGIVSQLNFQRYSPLLLCITLCSSWQCVTSEMMSKSSNGSHLLQKPKSLETTVRRSSRTDRMLE